MWGAGGHTAARHHPRRLPDWTGYGLWCRLLAWWRAWALGYGSDRSRRRTVQSGHHASNLSLFLAAPEWTDKTAKCGVGPTNMTSVGGTLTGMKTWLRFLTRTFTGLHRTVWEVFLSPYHVRGFASFGSSKQQSAFRFLNGGSNVERRL